MLNGTRKRLEEGLGITNVLVVIKELCFATGLMVSLLCCTILMVLGKDSVAIIQNTLALM